LRKAKEMKEAEEKKKEAEEKKAAEKEKKKEAAGKKLILSPVQEARHLVWLGEEKTRKKKKKERDAHRPQSAQEAKQAQSLHPLANKYKVKLEQCGNTPAGVTIETSSELWTDFEEWRALPATHSLYEAPARGKVLAIGKALNLLGEKFPSQECNGVRFANGLGEESARKRVIKKLWTAMADGRRDGSPGHKRYRVVVAAPCSPPSACV
jgi:hypothetical protein